MASTPTTSNRLELQGTGDNAGTWGDRLNTDVFDLIDESLDGVVSIPLGPDISLTSINYASDQARRRVLKFNGTGGTVTVPGVSKWYIVHNTCSGAAILKTAGGAGASVSPGSILQVYCDGTDCFLTTNLFPVQDGTVSAPGLYFSADTDTGFYRVAANSFAATVGGANVLGIAPAGITVTGSIASTGNITSSGNVIAPGAVFSGNMSANGITANGITANGITVSGEIIATGGISALSAALSGTAVIGGATTISGVLTTTNVVASTLATNAPLTYSLTNSSAGLSADSYFSASNGTNAAHFGCRGTAQTTYGALTPSAAYIYANAVPLVMMADSPAGTLLFASGGSAEVARSSRTASFATWRFGLSTYNFSSVVGAVSIGYAGDGTQYGIVMRPQADNAISLYFENAAGTTVGSVSQNTTNTVYSTSSDYRLKDDISDLAGSGAFIDALRPRQWMWKEGGARGAGFIAHEAAEVSPSSVTGEKDARYEDGQPLYQGMQPGSPEIIANMVAELQALRARLAALEAR